MAIPTKINLPAVYGDESNKYNLLSVEGSNRTTTGDTSYTSLTSGVTYNTATSYSGAYAGQGEDGLFQMLYDEVLNSYIVDDVYTDAVKLAVDTNTSDIATNISDIATNASNIAMNGKYNTSVVETRNINVDTNDTFTKSDFNSVKVNMPDDIADGAQITVEIDDDGIQYNLYSDYEGTVGVTRLEKGVYDIVFRDDTTDFFYLASKGGNDIIGWYNDSVSDGATDSGTLASVLSETGSGWITGIINQDVSTDKVFAIKADGSFIMGSATDGARLKKTSSIPLSVRYEASFEIYSDSTSVAISYVEGDTFDKATPQIFNNVAGTTTSNVIANITGSGWITTIGTVGNSLSLTVDGDSLVTDKVFQTCLPCNFRYETGFQLNGTSASLSYVIYIPD